MIKKIICVTVLLLIYLRCTAPEFRVLYIEETEAINPFEGVWLAVSDYESSNNPLAYNPDEGATGKAQIRQCRVDDYNTRTGSHYTLDDMFDPEISKKVFMYFANLHHFSDLEYVAKDWNGHGVMTINYWNEIKKRL